MAASILWVRKVIYIIGIMIILAGFHRGAAALAEPLEQGDMAEMLPLKVMTLNLHGGVNWYGQYDLDSVVRFIEEVQPDLIGMQEVDRGWSSASRFEDIPGELARRLKMFYAYSASLERNGGNFGNLVLSRYPIVAIWTELLPGALERRSFALVQVLAHGVRINFLTTHLGLSLEDRRQQAAAMLQFINQVNGPLIVTGDFNGGIEDPSVAVFREGLIDVQGASALAGQGTFRPKTGSVGPRIDYVFASPEFAPVDFRIFDNFISDHLPLVAELIMGISPLQIAGEPVYYQNGF